MKRLIFYAMLLLNISHIFAEEVHLKLHQITELSISTSINPAVYNYLKRHIETAKNDELILIKMNTPGGLVSTTKDIITLIGDANIPIAVYITPEGASATSAGAIIASSAHFLFMSEGTNIGAATPIGMGSDIKESDARSKAINDLVALVTSLSKTRGRNPKAFAKMISEAASLDSKTALAENVIDALIHNQKDLQKALEQRVFSIKGIPHKIEVSSNIKIIKKEMDMGQKILNVFADPSLAYILFIIGAALLYFELQAPGGFIAGAIGAFCLAMAAIGFQVLPLNIGAMGLIILGFILFVLEVYITSFGVLTIAGLISLTFGSLFLFRTDNSFMAIEQTVIFSTIFAIMLYVGFLGWFFFKTRQKEKFYKKDVRELGTILKKIPHDKDFLYQVRFNGEIWKSSSTENLNEGEEVLITEIDNDNLIIKIQKK